MGKRRIAKETPGPSRPDSGSSAGLLDTVRHCVSAEQLCLIIALAYLVIMTPLALHFHRIGDYGVETDFYGGLVQEARQFTRGDFPIGNYKGPVYGITLALLARLIPDYFTAAVVLSVLSAAVVLFLTSHILLRLFGPGAAILTALAVATNAQFLRYSYSAGTDMLFNAWMATAVYLLLREDKPTLPNLALAGLAGGCAYLTRYAGVALLLWGPLTLLLLPAGLIPRRRRIVSSAAFLAGAGGVIVAWGIHCYRATGHFIVNDNYRNIAFGIFGQERVSWDQFWSTEAILFHSFTDVLTRHPGLFLRTIAANLFTHLRNDLGFYPPVARAVAKHSILLQSLIHPALGIFALPGLFVVLRRRPDRRQTVFLLLSALFFGILLTVFYASRFSLYLVPTYLLLGVGFLLWFPRRFLGKATGPARSLTIALLLLLTAGHGIQVVHGEIGNGPTVILRLRDLLRQNRVLLQEGEVLVARKPHAAYYLNMKYAAFPFVDTMPALLDELRRLHARYLLYSISEQSLRPQFLSLLNAQAPHDGLRPILSIGEPGRSTQPAVLYEVLPP
jgi:4-amino-4-deoxy-L-arabinose transferase-like glycosyltransferase